MKAHDEISHQTQEGNRRGLISDRRGCIPAGQQPEGAAPSFVATVRHLLGIALAAGAAWGIVIAGLIIWPPSSSLPRADAIVVLSGDHGERLSKARVLLRRGVASTLVLDGEPDSPEANKLCAGGQSFDVICLRPHPDSTAGEARAAGDLSTTRRWKTLIVVTTNDHVLRARMRFRRCFKGTLAVEGAALPASTSIGRQAMVHEWLGTVNATLFDRGC